jgi:hypothetical protein
MAGISKGASREILPYRATGFIGDAVARAAISAGHQPNAAPGASMITEFVSLLPTILMLTSAIVFLGAGTINISGRGTVKADFARWGFPTGFNVVCGGLELVGAALLLSSSTRFWGLALLGAIMAGAILSLLRHREPLSHLAPAFGITALLALAAIAFR